VAALFPGDKVVALSQDYGYRLAYWGWITPRNWPTLDDIQLRQEAGQDLTLEDYFKDYTAGYDFFFGLILMNWRANRSLKNGYARIYRSFQHRMGF
jgi:hypothetical protein